MPLIEHTLFGKIDRVKQSISRLRAFEPEEGYQLGFSGGKDSVVLDAIADYAGVKHEAHYSLTTVDPPELVQFIKTFPDVTIDLPKETMWELIIRKRMPPTRLKRYCCEALKESQGTGRIVLTGVRWDESQNRKQNRHLVDIGKKGVLVLNDENDESRRVVESCYRTQKTLVNPIIDWSDEDVWEFIHGYGIRYCGLYDEGWKRLGCIGCPMANAEKEFERWPKYKDAYIRTFDRMIAKRAVDGLLPAPNYKTGQECFDWWVKRGGSDKPLDGQIDIWEE